MRRLALLCVALLAAGCYDSRFGERGDDATTDTVARFDHQVTVTSVFQYWLSWIRKAVIGTAHRERTACSR